MSQAYFLGKAIFIFAEFIFCTSPFIIKICKNPENLSGRSSGYCEKSVYPILFLKLIHFSFLKVHKHAIFFTFFAETETLWFIRACNTRFLKIVFDLAEIFDL